MHAIFRMVRPLLGLMMVSSLMAQEQTYTPPQLFSGTLYLSTSAELTATQAGILNAELERMNNAGSLVAIGSPDEADQSASWKLLKARTWADEPIALTGNAWSDEDIAKLQQLKRGSCVWLDHRTLLGVSETDRPKQSAALQACLARGVLMFLDAAHARPGDNLASGWNLVPDVDLLLLNDQAAAPLPANRVLLQIARDSVLRIGRREVVNLSDTAVPDCHISWPATTHYTEPSREALASRTLIDLTAARRALVERQQPVFPARQDYHPQLKSGSLVIVGGGGMPNEIWEKFIELAGGKDARIVVLPTAVAEPEYEDDYEPRILKRLGVAEVRVLPQTAREDVSKPEYLENFRWATGIWFGGGRQWRFVDAYWGTPAWDEIKQVVARGGVIGGSSAGATIQGDLLVRGHPLGNQIMVADGYRRGLGLLEGVAIDQHFKQRNRFEDLMSVVQRFPSIYAVGIDESTALVVQSPDKCQVLGKGSVWLSPPTAKDRTFQEHPSGNSFELED